MRMFPFLMALPALLTLAVTHADAAGGRGYRDTLLVLDRQFWEASARGDVDTIGRLFADDYLGIDQEQNRWTRAALLEQYRAVRTSDLRRAGDPEVIRLGDDSAVLTYEAAYKVHRGQEVVDSGPLRMSSCWAKRDGGWFVVFSQVCAVPRGSPAAAAPAPEPASAAPAAVGPAPTRALLQRDLLRPAGDGETLIATPQDPSSAAFAIGQPIRFELKVRNATGRALEGYFSTEAAFYCAPKVEDARGKPVTVSPPTVDFSGVWALVPYRVGPGEEKPVGTACLAFQPDGPDPDTARGIRTYCVAQAGAGKYRVTYPGAAAVDVEIR